MPTVILYWSPGRTAAQKKAVVEGITNTLVEQGGARREDVLVVFQNIEPGDAGRGGKMLGAPPESAANEPLVKDSK
jgi:4-oxalocrotonate tautomerase family enzyme